MVQVLKVTGKKRTSRPIPDWLNKPITGEEARQRARQYEEQMQRIAEGREA